MKHVLLIVLVAVVCAVSPLLAQDTEESGKFGIFVLTPIGLEQWTVEDYGASVFGASPSLTQPLSMLLPLGFGVAWRIIPRLELRATFYFTYSPAELKDDLTGSSYGKGHILSGSNSLSVFYNVKLAPGTLLYFGPRGEYAFGFAAFEPAGGGREELQKLEFGAYGVVGAQYEFSSHFGVFGDIGLGYTYGTAKHSVDPASGPTSTDDVATYGKIRVGRAFLGMVFYF